MAAVQTPGTPAPATEAASAEPSSTGDALLDALADYKGPEEDAPAAASGDDAAKAEPKKEGEPEKKTDEPAKPKTIREFENYLLSDGVLGTKEGIEKASAHFRRRQGKVDGLEARASERHAALDERENAINAAYEGAQKELDRDRQRAVAIRKIDEKLTNGTIEEMLETLGKIRGKTGREVWDQMARVAISMGKAAPVAAPAEIQRLEAQIERLTKHIEEREAKANEAAQNGETERLTAGLKEREAAVISAASDATKFPELARYVKLGLGESVVTEVVKQKTLAKREGRQLDNAGALAHIEAELTRLPAGATPASPAGAKPASPAAAIADDLPITGIAPSQTRSAGSAREKTEAELAEDLAKDHEFLKGAGLLF